MTNFLRNIYSSFLPSIARKELYTYLYANRPFTNWIVYELASRQVQNRHAAANKPTYITDNDIKQYIYDNYRSLEKECSDIVRALVRKILPGFDWLAILKHVGLFAICVVPAIYFLTNDLIDKWQYGIHILPSEVTALLFLIILLLCVGTALILSAFIRRD